MKKFTNLLGSILRKSAINVLKIFNVICKILEEETNREQFVSNEINNVLLTDQIFGTCFQCAPDNSSLNLYLTLELFYLSGVLTNNRLSMKI